MERYEEAVRSLETAVTLAPSDVNSNVNLGIALMNREERAGQGDLREGLPRD